MFRKYEDCKDMIVTLESVGGNGWFTIENLVDEIISNRRKKFFEIIKSVEEGKTRNDFLFDGISFIGATKKFISQGFDLNGEYHEGDIEYEIVAGEDWKWHCKTTITWEPNPPFAYGWFVHDTKVTANENVKKDRIYAMSRTSMSVHVIKNNLTLVTCDDVAIRQGHQL